MTTEFISGLCSSLSPVHRRILNASSKVKKIATSVRRATCELSVDLSIKIAKKIVQYECNKLYAKIFEIAVLLFIRFNRRDFIVKRYKGGVRTFDYCPPPSMYEHLTYYEYLIPGVPDGWMDDAVAEIVMGYMWNHIVPYIDDANAVHTVLRHQYAVLDTKHLMNILNIIAPSSIEQLLELLELRDDDNPALSIGTYHFYEEPMCSHIRLDNYLKKFRFNISFDANQRRLYYGLYDIEYWE
jgi:hypothetical protein